MKANSSKGLRNTMAAALRSRTHRAQQFAYSVLAILCFSCAGCRDATSPSVAEERPLVVANYSDVLTLDPHLRNEFLTQSVLRNVFEGLVEFDHELRVRPALAVSWNNPTDLVWQFHLRRDVVFHDGTVLDADDVVHSLDRARRNPLSDFGNYLLSVQRIIALDDHTVEITTHQPNALLLNKLCQVMIVPENSPQIIERPIGSGPYAFREYNRNATLVLDVFRHHWSGTVADFPSVEFVALPEGRDRADRLISGEVDFVMELRPEDVTRIEAANGIKVARHEGLIVEYLNFRIDRPPFSDPRLREAVHLALDRPALIASMMNCQAVPASQLVGRQVFGFSSSIVLPQPDLDRARQLISEAGFAEGLEVELEYRASRNGQAIADRLAEVGIHVTLRPRPWAKMFERLKKGEVAFYYGGTVSLSGDASDFFDGKIHTYDADDGYGDGNFSGYSNPEVDELIESSARIVNMLRRREVLETAMRAVIDDLPVAPLWIPYDLFGLDEEIEWQPRADGQLIVATMKRRTASE